MTNTEEAAAQSWPRDNWVQKFTPTYVSKHPPPPPYFAHNHAGSYSPQMARAEEMMQMWPCLRSSMPGRNAFIVFTVPR